MVQIESLSVIVPTRGRPENMAKLSRVFQETCADSTVLHWVVDKDDPAKDEYFAAYTESTYNFQSFWVSPKGPPGITHPLNYVVDQVFNPLYGFYPTILGFLGDDFEPITPQWDVEIEEALSRNGHTGIAYGNDLLQGEKLPTAWFVTRDIVDTLSFLSPPCLNHLYVDNYWLELGRGAECLTYLPDVILEHKHPLAGKAEWDATYEQNNNTVSARRDRDAFKQYKREGRLFNDIQLVKMLKGA